MKADYAPQFRPSIRDLVMGPRPMALNDVQPDDTGPIAPPDPLFQKIDGFLSVAGRVVMTALLLLGCAVILRLVVQAVMS